MPTCPNNFARMNTSVPFQSIESAKILRKSGKFGSSQPCGRWIFIPSSLQIKYILIPFMRLPHRTDDFTFYWRQEQVDLDSV
jgi:hypothetical protein